MSLVRQNALNKTQLFELSLDHCVLGNKLETIYEEKIHEEEEVHIEFSFNIGHDEDDMCNYKN